MFEMVGFGNLKQLCHITPSTDHHHKLGNATTQTRIQMSYQRAVPKDKYQAYRFMRPPSPPNDPISPFFNGIPKPDKPITHHWDTYEYPPVLLLKDYWTESIIDESSVPIPNPLSGNARRPRITGLSAELRAGTCRFTLSCPLRRGNDRWAQTWIGGILLSSGMMATVVIKVFQESRFPRPFVINDGGDRRDSERGEDGEPPFSRGARYASAEPNAYMKLQELQGERQYLVMLL